MANKRICTVGVQTRATWSKSVVLATKARVIQSLIHARSQPNKSASGRGYTGCRTEPGSQLRVLWCCQRGGRSSWHILPIHSTLVWRVAKIWYIYKQLVTWDGRPLCPQPQKVLRTPHTTPHHATATMLHDPTHACYTGVSTHFITGSCSMILTALRCWTRTNETSKLKAWGSQLPSSHDRYRSHDAANVLLGPCWKPKHTDIADMVTYCCLGYCAHPKTVLCSCTTQTPAGTPR